MKRAIWVIGTLCVLALVYFATNTPALLLLSTVARGNTVEWQGRSLVLDWGQYVVPPRDPRHVVIGQFGVRGALIELSESTLNADGLAKLGAAECEARRCTSMEKRALKVGGVDLAVVEQTYADSQGGSVLEVKYAIPGVAVLRFHGAPEAFSEMTVTMEALVMQLSAS